MTSNLRQVLWVDDEIEMLTAHFLFLKERGYEVTGAHSGDDALSLLGKQRFDLVLLDEQMPGMDGLTTLEHIKHLDPNLPVVMVTKSEEEQIMDEALGKKIDDYLTKPVNPSQILMVIKRLVEKRKIQSEHLAKQYVSDFNRLRDTLSPKADWTEWVDAHRLLSQWDLDLDLFVNLGLDQTHREHKREWNAEFSRWVEREYPGWMQNLESGDRPPLSVDIVSKYLVPHLKAGRKVYFFVIDCMRLDQWVNIETELSEYFQIERDSYFSLLPTATPFSRNAIFSGLTADEIQRLFPELWQIGDKDEFSRNRLERQLLDQQLDRLGVRLPSESKYVKVLDIAEGENVDRKFASYKDTPLLSVVYNFIDHLTHGRSENELLLELAPDEAAFRGLMKTWFVNSSWFKVLRKIARDPNAVVVVTTDHGSIMGSRGTVAHGRRDASPSLRYKFGDSLKCEPKDAVFIKDPKTYRLPTFTMSTTYLIAKEDYYFVYPTNFNEYQRKFANTFLHGGISMPEMILPRVDTSSQVAVTVHLTESEHETVAVAREFALQLSPGDWVGFVGPLGAGKSVFARAVGVALGVTEPMPSPTYTLMNVVQGNTAIYHVDLYRLGSADELDFSGIVPYFESAGICLVEWADRIRTQWPTTGWLVTIQIVEHTQRRITIARLTADD